jgi:hypothetical protein
LVAEPSGLRAAGRCAFCGAANTAQAAVCAGCGANRAGVAIASAAFRERQSAAKEANQARLIRSQTDAFSRTLSSGWRRLLALLGVVALTVAVLATLMFLVVNTYLEQQRARTQRLATLAEAAYQCAQAGDNSCARDQYLALVDQDGSYPDAQEGLTRARLSLASQYAKTQQWALALDETNAVLDGDVTNMPARVLGRNVIDQWLTQALNQGDWLTWLRLRAVRDLRYRRLS